MSTAHRVALGASAQRSSRLPGRWRWDWALAVAALVAAAVGFWVTLRAGFLAYPDWLAVQKADFILGPIAVGLYWRHRRPKSRLGPLLIALGLVGIVYILESTTVPVLFGVGLYCENVIYVLTSLAILTFVSGRLDGPAERLLVALVVISQLVQVALGVVDPHFGPAFSISGCRASCPRNALAFSTSTPSWWPQLSNVGGALLVATPVATAALVVWRFVTGSSPRRRALAIGAPLALLFLAMQASYRTLFFLYPNSLSPAAQPVHSALQWTFAGARALVWYGFLFALIGAELFAGRALNALVRDSMGRPSLGELERMLRGPLGDPRLRLGFWRPHARDFADADGETLAPLAGQALTQVERDGRPAVAMVHDKQLAQDPELLQAAGAVALLAEENADLESAWKESLHELADSRARLVTAADRERRKLERDLHDGAQQQLMAIQHAVRVAQDEIGGEVPVPQLEAIGQSADQALDEVRTLAHGIYPHVLRDLGLADGVRSFARTVPFPVEVKDRGVGRCALPVEAAIYFCSTEAIQNAVKHAGENARITVTLGREEDRVEFVIGDDGVGMDTSERREGDGLIGMRDRIGAVGGALEIISAPGSGTTIRGTVPLAESPAVGDERGRGDELMLGEHDITART
jgi:signal transduction histidine kinase